MNMEGYSRQVIKLIEDRIPDILNNSDVWLASLVTILAFFFLVLWMYCGFFMFYDSIKRFGKSPWVFFLLVIGLLFGPFALVLYLIARPRQTLEDKAFMHLERRFFYNEASKVLHCLNCDTYVLENHVFCTQCGTQNRYKCPKCGALGDYDDKYCWKCGYDFGDRYQKLVQSIQKKKLTKRSTVRQSKKTKKHINNFNIKSLIQKIDILKRAVDVELDTSSKTSRDNGVSEGKTSKPHTVKSQQGSQQKSQQKSQQESQQESQKESQKNSPDSLGSKNNSEQKFS